MFLHVTTGHLLSGNFHPAFRSSYHYAPPFSVNRNSISSSGDAGAVQRTACLLFAFFPSFFISFLPSFLLTACISSSDQGFSNSNHQTGINKRTPNIKYPVPWYNHIRSALILLPFVLSLFAFNAPCQFTPLLNLFPLIVGLMLSGWLPSITLTPHSQQKYRFWVAPFFLYAHFFRNVTRAQKGLIVLRECKATTPTDYEPNLLGDMPTKYIDLDSSVALGLFSFSSPNTSLHSSHNGAALLMSSAC